MAQFRATIKGQCGEASRLGTKNSGIVATINGWNVGVTVIAHHRNGKDYIEVRENGGSNGNVLLSETRTLTIHEP